MNIHVKDPGSALTHFIAMLGAAAAAVSPSHEGRSRTWPKRPSGGGSGGFYCEHDPASTGPAPFTTLSISPRRSTAAQKAGSYDDLYPDSRNLYTGVSDRSWRPVRVLPAGARLGNCDCRYYY